MNPIENVMSEKEELKTWTSVIHYEKINESGYSQDILIVDSQGDSLSKGKTQTK